MKDTPFINSHTDPEVKEMIYFNVLNTMALYLKQGIFKWLYYLKHRIKTSLLLVFKKIS